MKKRKIISGILFLIITIFIFSNSAKPAVESSEQSGFFVEIFIRLFGAGALDMAEHIVRKTAHMIEFFAQAVTLLIFFFEDYRKYIIYVLFTGLLTAVTDEYIQLFFDGRAGMIQDVFIDFSGTLLAALLFFVLFTIRKKMERV